MWVFLATEVLFFGVLFASYTVNRILQPEAFAAAAHHTDVVLGSINTGILFTSSLTMALAVHASTLGERRTTSGWLVVTALLGSIFLVIKGAEYHKEYTEGLIPTIAFDYTGPHPEGARMFFFLYYVMTGLHALHLLIGIGVVSVITVLNRRGRFSKYYNTPVELTGLYWGFVDIVWVFLYPLFYLVARA
jgi:cytochrome c oxidase subunit 3